jgi:hypothetical protein
MDRILYESKLPSLLTKLPLLLFTCECVVNLSFLPLSIIILIYFPHTFLIYTYLQNKHFLLLLQGVWEALIKNNIL